MIAVRRSLFLELLLVAVLSSLLAAVYWAGLQGPFVFDDYVNIVENPSLKTLDGSLSSLIAAATSGISSPLGRPISMASFALNVHFYGDGVYSFKLANLVIHLANTLLVFVLVRQLSRYVEAGDGRSQPLLLAAGISAAWAFHPQNVTPVLYVVQRMTSLSALFVFLALSLYLYGRQAGGSRGWLAVSAAILICWPAAVLSKETGILLPAYMFLCEWLLLRTFRFIPAKAKWSALGVGLAMFIILCWDKWAFLTAGYGVRDFSLAERLMTEARVLWFYVQQLLLPLPQVFGLFHDDIPISRGLVDPPSTIWAITAWFAIAGLAFHQRAKRPVFAFAVFWFLASHLLESTVFPLEIAYEHRNYVASVGLFLWLGNLTLTTRPQVPWLVPRLVLATSFLALCGLVTSMRSLQWADEFQRTQAEVANHANSARANHAAASAMMKRTFELGGGNPMAYQMVQFHLKRAAELDQNSKAPLLGLLYLDCAAGARKNTDIRLRLRERLSSARFSFGDRVVIQGLSTLLVEDRLCLDANEVKAVFDAALSNPSADGLMRGIVYSVAMDYALVKMHSVPLALAYAQAAAASDPASIPIRVNLIQLYLQSNRVDEARLEYINAVKVSSSLSDKAALAQLLQRFDLIGENAGKRS